jgi:hypothetical protein
MSASARLQMKLDIAYPAMRAASERIWCSPDVRELYPAYLRTMHAIVRTASPLLRAASDRAAELAPVDDVAAGLVDYLAHHAGEEAGHDAWLLEDLAATGHDPDAPLRSVPSPRVAAFAGAQYYWLRHHHPVCVLGHMAVIEGYPPQPGFARRLSAATGYPIEAFRALARHERLDIKHRRELLATIDALPLRPEHEAAMGVSALHTVQAAIAVMDDIFASVPASNTTTTTTTKEAEHGRSVRAA